jgi:putative DNA primase/helicase
MLDAALALAARGWPVFPCHPNDKRPLVGESSEGAGDAGLYRATCDQAQIREWWKRWPDAMIGVPTGAPIGAWVIDVDPKGGVTVDQVLEQIEQTVGERIPPAPMVRTPRGGLHIYLALPDGLELGNRAGVIPHVDVRGTGGYVIVPPSVRRGAKARKDGCEGKAYEWLAEPSDVPPPLPSAAFVQFATSRHADTPSKAAPAARPAPVADDRVRKYALAALDTEIQNVASAGRGGRNDALNRAAFALGQLVGAGALSESVVTAALEDAAAACGLIKDDGLRSVRATIRSGLRDGMAAPRDLSEIAASRRRPPPARGARSLSSARPANPERGEPAGNSGGDGERADADEIAQACAREPLNDIGNARRLRHRHGRDMLYVREVGEHWWAGTHWEPEGAAEAFNRAAQATAEAIAIEAEWLTAPAADRAVIDEGAHLIDRPVDELSPADRQRQRAAREAMERLGKRREARRKFAISSGNASRINGMLALAIPHMTVGPDKMDTEPLAINVRNGTLRLYSEIVKEPDPDCPDPAVTRYIERKRWRVRLDPHRREDRISKVMPVEYQPGATCPRWDEFMQRFQPKQRVREFLQMFHGYCLTGLMGEQVFVYNYGLGANGKSTFMEALARLMGPYAQVLPPEAITGDLQRRGDQATPEFARLPGARMVRCAELPRGQGIKESVLKMLTGGEPILVRHLHARFFEFTPTFKAIGSGNDRPPIAGVDEGIWRRMKLVPWEVTIPPKERRPMAKVLAEFEAERPGILNWLLAGLIDYLENGWWVPDEVQGATDSYRADMDPVGEFCQACVVQSPGDTVTARDMYIAYVAWAHANSVRPFAEKTFAAIMAQKGYEKAMGRIRTYQNVGLKDVPEDPEKAAEPAPHRYWS